MDFTDPNTVIFPVGHLPLVRAAMEELQILDIIEELSPLRTGSRVTDAECVGAMIFNVLSGHVALYRMEERMALLDAELLLGEGVPANALNDTRLAAMLDHVDRVGTDNILSAVVGRYLERPDRVREYSVHQDTTSIRLWGAYFGEHDPQPAYGYSKDHRPDLKQLIFGLTLHGNAGIPLVHSVVAGNTSDPAANRGHLAQLSKLLPREDEVTVVADCKLVDADTLGRVLGAGFHLVSLVPDSFALRQDLIDQAWLNFPELDSWPELGRQRGPRKGLPDKVYRGVSFERPMQVNLRGGGRESAEPVVSFEPMRFVVVNSTALADKFDTALPDRLDRERRRLENFARASNRKGYACEEDALADAQAQVKSVRYHKVEITVTAVVNVNHPWAFPVIDTNGDESVILMAANKPGDSLGPQCSWPGCHIAEVLATDGCGDDFDLTCADCCDGDDSGECDWPSAGNVAFDVDSDSASGYYLNEAQHGTIAWDYIANPPPDLRESHEMLLLFSGATNNATCSTGNDMFGANWDSAAGWAPIMDSDSPACPLVQRNNRHNASVIPLPDGDLKVYSGSYTPGDHTIYVNYWNGAKGDWEADTSTVLVTFDDSPTWTQVDSECFSFPHVFARMVSTLGGVYPCEGG